MSAQMFGELIRYGTGFDAGAQTDERSPLKIRYPSLETHVTSGVLNFLSGENSPLRVVLDYSDSLRLQSPVLEVDALPSVRVESRSDLERVVTNLHRDRGRCDAGGIALYLRG